MVAHAADAAPPQTAAGRRIPIRARSGVQRLVLSLVRIASIQSRLAILQAKLAVQRIVVFAALTAVAALLALLGIIFLYIGVFKVLTTYVMSPMWAYLAYGGFHVLLAIGIFFWARHTLHTPEDEPDEEKHREEHTEHEPAAAERTAYPQPGATP